MKSNKKIYIDNMIALCYIVEEYEEFEKNLKASMPKKQAQDFVFGLWKISQGNNKTITRKVKKFYENNQRVINTINKYSSIIRFISLNSKENKYLSEDIPFFYEYILLHKKDIPNILEILEKLKELEFRKIEFNETLDFTKEKYDAYQNFDKNTNIVYVANPEVIPNYIGHINYKTKSSNYKITLGLVGNKEKEISPLERSIILNSLIFDVNTLPEKIDKEHIFTHLLNTSNLLTSKIKSTIDLNISIFDLEEQLNNTSITINQLDNVKNKDEIKLVLSKIKEHLIILNSLTNDHNQSISKEEAPLTKEIIEQEKIMYLKRRPWYKKEC